MTWFQGIFPLLPGWPVFFFFSHRLAFDTNRKTRGWLADDLNRWNLFLTLYRHEHEQCKNCSLILATHNEGRNNREWGKKSHGSSERVSVVESRGKFAQRTGRVPGLGRFLPIGRIASKMGQMIWKNIMNFQGSSENENFLEIRQRFWERNVENIIEKRHEFFMGFIKKMRP